MFPYVNRAVFGLLDPVILTRTELLETASRHGAVYRYASEETFDLPPPASPPDLQGNIAACADTHTHPQPFVCELRDCTLLGGYPIALTDRGELPLEAVVREIVLVRNLVGSLANLLARPTRLRGLDSPEHIDTACLLFNHWTSGYFHWMYESLIRLQGVEVYRERTGRQPTLVLGPDPPDWQRETLELLGYGPEDWIEWSTTRATVDRLVVPTVRRGLVVSPDAVRWLRERFRTGLRERSRTATDVETPSDTDVGSQTGGPDDSSSPAPDQLPDRVYVSRADATRRQVINEEEVMAALAHRGFERVVLSELSIPMQAAIFEGAEVIVAPHGAGLTNLTFADDPVVVELFKEGDIRGQYYQLAAILDFEYHYRVVDGVGPHVRVDVSDLLETLDRVDVLPAGTGPTGGEPPTTPP